MQVPYPKKWRKEPRVAQLTITNFQKCGRAPGNDEPNMVKATGTENDPGYHIRAVRLRKHDDYVEDFCVVGRRTLDELELILPLPQHCNRHLVGGDYTAELNLYWTYAASTARAPSAIRHDDVDLIHASELG